MKRALEILQKIVPIFKKVEPKKRVATRPARKSSAKEEDVDTSPADKSYDSSMLRLLIKEHDENTTIMVIQKILEVLNSSEGFFKMITVHGGPEQVIEYMMTKHQFTIDEVIQLYAYESGLSEAPNAASGSAGPNKNEQEKKRPNSRSRSPKRRSPSPSSSEESIPLAN